MIINELLPSQQPGKTSPAGRPAPGGNFGELLENQLNRLAENQGPAPVAAPAETQTASPALRIEGLSLTEDLLAHLDQFSSVLAQPSFQSSELEPFVEALEEETSALVAVKSELPTGDPLAALLDRVAAAAYVETAKYRRGDYTA